MFNLDLVGNTKDDVLPQGDESDEFLFSNSTFMFTEGYFWYPLFLSFYVKVET